MEKNYEFENETRKHIAMVSSFLNAVSSELLTRSVTHDLSKLDSPELPIYEANWHNYKTASSGSQELKDAMQAMKPAFDHHLKVNRHHPEYFVMNDKDVKLEHAMSQLTIVDLIQTFVDWIATAKRQNINVFDLLDKMAQKYNIHLQLLQILRNSVPSLEQYVSVAKTKDSLTQELDEIHSMNKDVVHNFDKEFKLVKE